MRSWALGLCSETGLFSSSCFFLSPKFCREASWTLEPWCSLKDTCNSIRHHQRAASWPLGWTLVAYL